MNYCVKEIFAGLFVHRTVKVNYRRYVFYGAENKEHVNFKRISSLFHDKK